MKVLWVTAQIIPLVAEELKVKKTGFGGWVMNMLDFLNKEDDIELGIAMVSTNVDKMLIIEKENIKCFIARDLGTKSIDEKTRDQIIATFKPDIIHIEGTEFEIHNSFSRIKNIPTLVSLQGILEGYEPYQYGQIELIDKLFSFNASSIISSLILFLKKRLLFTKRLKYEAQTIRNAKYLSGRTSWDRAHSYWINPMAEYFVCNRILRKSFYNIVWNKDRIEKNTIFIGNGYSPLKGLHFVLKAIKILKVQIPDIKLIVAGDKPILESKGMTVKKYGYSKIISKYIDDNKLQNNVKFTGPLLEKDMVEQMLKSNVYVLPSLIENSPNTLGEAMILGMPCVSAYAGGAPDMAVDGKECLFYRANDSSMLAWQIKRVLENDELAISLGEEARKHARFTHDPVMNKSLLISAYKTIIKSNDRKVQ